MTVESWDICNGTFISTPYVGVIRGIPPPVVGEKVPPEHMRTEVSIENPDLVDTFDADKRGRISLGKSYAHEQVRIALEKVDNGD